MRLRDVLAVALVVWLLSAGSAALAFWAGRSQVQASSVTVQPAANPITMNVPVPVVNVGGSTLELPPSEIAIHVAPAQVQLSTPKPEVTIHAPVTVNVPKAEAVDDGAAFGSVLPNPKGGGR